MAKSTENTVVSSATSTIDSSPKPTFPNNKQFISEQNYFVSMSIFKNMLNNNLITSDEYHRINKILANKYSSFLSTLY